MRDEQKPLGGREANVMDRLAAATLGRMRFHSAQRTPCRRLSGAKNRLCSDSRIKLILRCARFGPTEHNIFGSFLMAGKALSRDPGRSLFFW